MKCTHCGRRIGIEDIKCPHCGTENELAVQHARNMGQYETEFKQTEKEAADTAGKYEGLGKRAVILVVLLIGIVLSTIISIYHYAPDELEEDKKKEQDAIQNYAQYSKEMDRYLEQGEYMEYMTFVYSHCIYRMEANETYWKYHYFNRVAEEYYDCMKDMEEIILCLKTGDEDYPLDMKIDFLGGDIGSFFETLEKMQEEEMDETLRSYLPDMEAELRAAILTYLKMDEEQLKDFLTLSDTGKALRLEEVLKHE